MATQIDVLIQALGDTQGIAANLRQLLAEATRERDQLKAQLAAPQVSGSAQAASVTEPDGHTER